MTLPQHSPVHSSGYQDTHLTVDFEREVAYLDGARLKLTYKAYSLLAFLVRHSGELVPREALLSMVWGYTNNIRTRTLDVHVRRLRKSLGPYGTSYIETIFGVGYRFQPYRAGAARHDSPALPIASLANEPKSSWKMAAGSAN